MEQSENDVLIDVRGLSVKVGRRYLLDDFNWKVRRGEQWVVFGMNGSGKTTLLSIISGYRDFTGGTVRLFGKPYDDLDLFEIRKRIGWVSSSFFDNYYRNETVLEIIVSSKSGTLGMESYFDEKDVRKAKVWLHRFGLDDKCNMPFNTLSKGERQNVLLIRAMFNEPDVLILDEPCSGLDIDARVRVLGMVREIAEETDTSIVYVSHYPEELLDVFTNALLIKRGRCFMRGTMQECFNDETMIKFLGFPTHVANDVDGHMHMTFDVPAQNWRVSEPIDVNEPIAPKPEAELHEIVSPLYRERFSDAEILCNFDVQRMAKLRRFKIEYEIYGTAYWEDGERVYLTSRSYEAMYRKIVELADEGRYPLPVQEWIERRLVPAGCDDEVGQQVKVNASAAMQENFPARYWETLEQLMGAGRNDAGVAVIEPLRDQLEGSFDEDLLQVFRSLLDRVYQRGNLLPETYASYRGWLAQEYRETADDIPPQRVDSKVMYGIAYREGNGEISVIMDAFMRNVVLPRRRIEAAGNATVTPFFSKKCFYNYDTYVLADARRDFTEELKDLFDENYFKILADIDELPLAVDPDAFKRAFAQAQADGMSEAYLAALREQGADWGIR